MLSEVAEILLPLPPIEEQRRIVAKLQSLFSNSKRARAELDCIRQLVSRTKEAILDAAFRGALTAAWRTIEQQSIEIADEERVMKKLDSARRDAWFARLGPNRRTYSTGEKPKWFPNYSLPTGWYWVSVDQIVAFTQYGTSAKTDSLSSRIPVLRMGNLQDGRIDFSNLKYLPRTHNEFPDLLLETGDVLFNRTNSPELVGKTEVFMQGTGLASFASYLIRLRPIGYLPNLLAAYINSPIGRTWIRDVVSQQVGQANVNATKLCQLAVPFMPTAEQQEIIRRIDAAFTKIGRLAIASLPVG